MQRWAVEISRWDPSPSQFAFCVSLLPCQQQLHVTRYWCLKEAYVKATGAGLGYGLNKLEFHHTNWTDIHVLVDGKQSDEWQFKITELSKNCWISVAKGHPKEAVTSYKKTLTRTEFGMEEHRHALMLPDKEFDMLSVEDLIPKDKRGAYYALIN